MIPDDNSASMMGLEFPTVPAHQRPPLDTRTEHPDPNFLGSFQLGDQMRHLE